MDELDVFRAFRSGVAAPRVEAERRASARLTRAIERGDRRRTRVLRLLRTRPRRTALAVAALGGAAAAALFVSAPWRDSPGFLERAEAALTPPAGTILHVKWETTRISREFGCTVRLGPNELWIEQKPPYRYRLVNHDPGPSQTPSRRANACAGGSREELGGLFTGSFRFVPPDRLVYVGPTYEQAPPDFARDLRGRIARGEAHDEGLTELDGRAVRKIRLKPACPGLERCPQRADYAYVDARTFVPVLIDSPYGYALSVGGPLLRFRTMERFLIYEYLPRTAANLALTDIRAQHPGATIK